MSWISCQYCRDKPSVINNGVIVAFNVANVTDSFNFKEKITGETYDNSIKDVEIIVPLKCLSNFLRTLVILLIIGKLILFWLGTELVLKFLLLSQIKVQHF